MLNELEHFHAEASKRNLIISIKECGLLLHSLQSKEFASKTHSVKSEKPIYSYIRALFQLGDIAEIIELTNNTHFDDPIMTYFRIQALMKCKIEPVEKVKSFMDKIPEDVSDEFIRFCKAKLCFMQEDYSSAFSECLMVLQSSPFFWEAWLLLIDSVREIDQITVLTKFISSMQSLMSLNAALLLHIKIRNSTTRNLFTLLETILKQQNDIDNNYFKIILSKYYVVECRKTAPITNPLCLQMADLYSDFLYVNSKKDELKIFAKEVSAAKRWTKEACYVIGNLYSITKQHEKALVWLRRALIIDSNYENALIVSGNEYIEIKSPNDAIEAYSEAIKLNPLNYRSFFSLGSVYFLLDDLERSIYFLKTAIRLETEDYRAFELLSECYHNLGFPDHALEYLKSAIKCPGSPTTLFKKSALLYYSIGNVKEYFNFYIKYFDNIMIGDGSDIVLISDELDFEAASRISENCMLKIDESKTLQLDQAILRYNK